MHVFLNLDLNSTGFRSNRSGKLLPEGGGLTGPVGFVNPGIGLITMDHAGLVLLTAWKVIQRCSSIEGAEATACPEGVQLAVELIGKCWNYGLGPFILINAIKEFKTHY